MVMDVDSACYRHPGCDPAHPDCDNPHGCTYPAHTPYAPETFGAPLHGSTLVDALPSDALRARVLRELIAERLGAWDFTSVAKLVGLSLVSVVASFLKPVALAYAAVADGAAPAAALELSPTGVRGLGLRADPETFYANVRGNLHPNRPS